MIAKFSAAFALIALAGPSLAQQPTPREPANITAYRRLLDEANQRIAADAVQILDLQDKVDALTTRLQPKTSAPPTLGPTK